MPVKDPPGSPRRTAAERSRERRLLAEVRARASRLSRRGRRGLDEPPEPVTPPDAPRPRPLDGAAAVPLPERPPIPGTEPL